jgi:hypothetical protein
MSPNLARHLYTLAELIPCSRHKSGTLAPASFYFKIAIIWLSVNRDIFM